MNIGTQLIASFVKSKYTVYFDSFGVEHIPKEINKFIRSKELRAKALEFVVSNAVGKKEIKANIFRLQTYDSIMCGYFCIEFINYMFDGKSLIDFTSLFLSHDFKKNDQIIIRIFKNE